MSVTLTAADVTKACQDLPPPPDSAEDAHAQAEQMHREDDMARTVMANKIAQSRAREICEECGSLKTCSHCPAGSDIADSDAESPSVEMESPGQAYDDYKRRDDYFDSLPQPPTCKSCCCLSCLPCCKYTAQSALHCTLACCKATAAAIQEYCVWCTGLCKGNDQKQAQTPNKVQVRPQTAATQGEAEAEGGAAT